MTKKYFTLEEAQSELPRISKIMSHIFRIKREISLLSSVDVHYEDELVDVRANNRINKEFHKLLYHFYEQVESLDNIGCILKDLDIGLVDFYSRFESRDILLCWKFGETQIRFWHELDSGFQGRRPVEELVKKRA